MIDKHIHMLCESVNSGRLALDDKRGTEITRSEMVLAALLRRQESLKFTRRRALNEFQETWQHAAPVTLVKKW